jgi:hypothetical protein
VCKNPPQGGRKTVPRQSPGRAQAEGDKTSGSENETHLVAGPPGRAVAGLAAALGPGGLPRHRRLPGVASESVQVFRWLMETT